MECTHEGYTYFTDHAKMRKNQRNISRRAIDWALEFGRVVHTRGACYFVLGRHEIKKILKLTGNDASKYNGLQVVCTADESSVITIFRNPKLTCLHAGRPRRRNA